MVDLINVYVITNGTMELSLEIKLTVSRNFSDKTDTSKASANRVQILTRRQEHPLHALDAVALRATYRY